MATTTRVPRYKYKAKPMPGVEEPYRNRDYSIIPLPDGPMARRSLHITAVWWGQTLRCHIREFYCLFTDPDTMNWQPGRGYAIPIDSVDAKGRKVRTVERIAKALLLLQEEYDAGMLRGSNFIRKLRIDQDGFEILEAEAAAEVTAKQAASVDAIPEWAR